LNGIVVIEGHGEVEAVVNLLTRLTDDLGLPWIHWRPPIRKAVTSERVAIEVPTSFASGRNIECLLVLRDGDDGCPKVTGPELARWLANANLPFPAAATLLHREYEALFLPCVSVMAGKTLQHGAITTAGLLPGTEFVGDPESIRDVKGWLTRHFPPGRSYRPTTDQLPLTRMINFQILRESELPCFGTLERALRFVASGAGPGAVYPPFTAI
jgi:Domain of unknown function (DUF4276)